MDRSRFIITFEIYYCTSGPDGIINLVSHIKQFATQNPSFATQNPGFATQNPGFATQNPGIAISSCTCVTSRCAKHASCIAKLLCRHSDGLVSLPQNKLPVDYAQGYRIRDV